MKALRMLAAPGHVGMKETLMFLDSPGLGLHPRMVLPSPMPTLIWAQFSRVQIAQKIKAKGSKTTLSFPSSLEQQQ